ncbi:MAG: N-acetylneuraminate synthase family protein [Selenomonadaceae bacterium]|nr:N-acetylneuraminate synthase family protein [Selenomonadaceae bacterium]
MKTIIIAEIGECFNGDIKIAKKLMEKAKEAGCDIVKFQLLDLDEVAMDDPERAWFEKITITPSMLRKFILWAKNLNLEILFTPVSVRTAVWLVEEGIKTVKIASSFVSKAELLEFINNNFDTVYASTGMASLDEIAFMVEKLCNVKDLRLLHCISEYPTGPLLEERGLKSMDEADAHLYMMQILKNKYPNCMVGYSDHTDDIFVPSVAVAMGAEIIEKHITLDRNTPIEHFKKNLEYMGTDHVVSVEPDKLREMVRNIRRIEAIKGSVEWKRSEGEKILMRFLKSRYKER